MPYRTELKRPDLKGQFPCSVCGKVFCHSSSLSRHRMQAHFKSYTCTQCNQEISSNETLRSHMFKYHQISRMFMCRCCNWAFPDKTSLHIHMQSMSRNGRPGDVAVLARSSIEGENDFINDGESGVVHSPSTSPHDEDLAGHYAGRSSASPSLMSDELRKIASPQHTATNSGKFLTPSLLNNSTTNSADLLSTINAMISGNGLGSDASGALINSKFKALFGTNNNSIQNSNDTNSTIFPSSGLQQNSQNQQQSLGSGANSNPNALEFLKKLRSKTSNSKEFLSAINFANSQLANNQTNHTIFATNDPKSHTNCENLLPQAQQQQSKQQQNQQQQQQWLLTLLKNNPFLTNTEGTNSKAAFLAALAVAARSQNNVTSVTSALPKSSLTNTQTAIQQQQQHLPHTPSAASTMMSDISRLLCMSNTMGQNAVPPAAKRQRVQSHNVTGYGTNGCQQQQQQYKDIASALKAIRQQQNLHAKSEPSSLNEDAEYYDNFENEKNLGLSISTTLASMHMADASSSASSMGTLLPIAAASHLSAGGESSSAGAMSSSASSPRADTPSGKLLNSVIDKMLSTKRESGGGADSDGRASSLAQDNSTTCTTPISDSRRNKRKARVPQQLTTTLGNSKECEEKVTHLPASKTSLMPGNLTQLGQQQHSSETTNNTTGKQPSETAALAVRQTTVGFVGAGGSEQPSPAVSDSQTSGSSTTSNSNASAATQILELLTASGTTAAAVNSTNVIETTAITKAALASGNFADGGSTQPKICCFTCQDTKNESVYLKSRVQDLEVQLNNLRKNISGIVTKMLNIMGNNSNENSQNFHNCLKSIEELLNMKASNNELVNCESVEFTSIPKCGPLGAGLDAEDDDDYGEINENRSLQISEEMHQGHQLTHDEEEEVEMMDDEEEDGTIEIRCGPSPMSGQTDKYNEDTATPSPRPDVTANAFNEESTVPIFDHNDAVALDVDVDYETKKTVISSVLPANAQTKN